MDGGHAALCPPYGAAARSDFSITARSRDRMYPVVTEHMRHKAGRTKNFREGHIANAQAAGIGAERGHHGALAIARKTPPLHRASPCGDAGLRMQMAGD